MRILLTNDDGIDAAGINVLKRRLLQDGHDVMVFAPSSNKSGSSHSINLGSDVTVKKIDEKNYSCTGSPADCVMTAVKSGVFSNVDIVLSGINQGPNIGLDITYSGTCGAARQAVYYGIPAAALSVMAMKSADDVEPFFDDDAYNYEAMADFAAKNLANFSKMCVVAENMRMPKTPCCFANVNGPSSKQPYKEARWAGLSFREYSSDKIELFCDEEGVFGRRFSGGKVVSDSREFSDWDALAMGFVAVTRVFAEPVSQKPLDEIQFVL